MYIHASKTVIVSTPNFIQV